jgi:hypothetical protein
MVVPVSAPGFQVYVEAPVPVKVAVLPIHNTVGLELAVKVSVGFTVNETVVVFEQIPLSPVTVYIVVAVGVTTIVVPVNAPGFHVYEVAPFAVNVDELPEHIAVGDAIAVTVGLAMTFIVSVLVVEQPVILAPVTE